MKELTPPTQPPAPPPTPSPKKNKHREVLAGALLGLAPGLLSLLVMKSNAIIVVFLVSISLWPLSAIVLAVLPKTRRFGLGMLLGVGFTAMVLLAVCGGMTASSFR